MSPTGRPAACWWLAVLLVPGAIAFAHDGILIGAGDYRFLGRAALGYLAAVAPLAVLILLVPELGIAGVWGALLLWMLLRAAVNDRRTRRVLGGRESHLRPRLFSHSNH